MSTNKRPRFVSGGKRRFKGKPSVQQVRTIVQNAIYRESETKMVSAFNNENFVNTIAADVTIHAVPTPAQGVATHERIGNKIKGVGIGSKLLLHNNAGNTPCWVRCSLLEVFDGQMTDTEIKSDLFEGTGDSTVSIDGNLVNIIKKYDREFYRVLKDEVIPLHGNTDTDSVKIVSFYKKLKGQEMKFNDQFANQPVGTSRFVWVLYAREADGDEDLGTNVEITSHLDYYFKE